MRRYPKVAIFTLNVVALAVFWPFGPKPVVHSATCMGNLKALATAAQMYAGDYDGRLFDRDSWMDATAPYVTNQSHFVCPDAPASAGVFGYAFNSNMSLKKVASVPDGSRTPLLYDSMNMARNASDPFTSLAVPGRHGPNDTVAYLDGHVAVVDARLGKGAPK